MTAYRVFVEAASPSRLVDAVSTFLSVSMSCIETDAGPVFRGITEDSVVSVFEDHGLVDDAGIPFTKYRFEVLLEPIEQFTSSSSRIEAKLEQKAKDMAAEICSKLATHCMVVRGLQVLVHSC